MSAPAANWPSAPRTITQRTPSSAASVPNTSRSSPHMATVMAFRRPGCDSVTQASGPSRASRTRPEVGVADMAALPDAGNAAADARLALAQPHQVVVQVVQVVEIVDHHAAGLAQALGRGIGGPVQPF